MLFVFVLNWFFSFEVKGHWTQFFVATLVSVFNLFICIALAQQFGKLTSVIFLLVVGIACYVSLAFGLDRTPVTRHFNLTEVPHCVDNCTYGIYNGTFLGLSGSNVSQALNVFGQNFWPDSVYDCEDRLIPVSASTAFAVLFSGVTGIMAGANLSGELKNPSSAIPGGTAKALGFTAMVYLLVASLTALTCERTLLYHDCNYMSAVVKNVYVSLGAGATTLIASTSGMLGASRLLQAMAEDDILPLLSGSLKGYGKLRGKYPWLASLISYLCVQAMLFLRSLNQIAKVCAVFYLLSYAFVNLACCLLDLSSAVNFRPLQKCHWAAAGLGAVACCALMPFMSPVATLVGVAFAAIFAALVNFAFPPERKDWGSVGQGVLYHQVRKYLLRLDVRKYHVKHWRPQILLAVADSEAISQHAILVTNALKKGGIFVVGHVFRGSGSVDDEEDGQKERCVSVAAIPAWTELLVDKLKVKAFVELTVAPNMRAGIRQLARLSGLGAMRPNILMLGFKSHILSDEEEKDRLKQEEEEREAGGLRRRRRSRSEPESIFDEDGIGFIGKHSYAFLLRLVLAHDVEQGVLRYPARRPLARQGVGGASQLGAVGHPAPTQAPDG